MTIPERLGRRWASLSAWTAPDNDPKAVAAMLGRLIAGFQATGRLVGDHHLVELVHEATGTRVVAVTGFPWQDRHEVISAHAAARGLWRGEGAVRAVWDLEWSKPSA